MKNFRTTKELIQYKYKPSDHYEKHLKGNENYKNWCAENGIISELKGKEWVKVINKYGDIPRKDHARGYNSYNGYILVSQPYSLSDKDIKEIKEWAIKKGVDVEIFSPAFSWHYCDHTFLVIARI